MFDVNVYLDLADLFGGPVRDINTTFSYALRRHADRDTYPHPAYLDDHRAVDSLRAVALAAHLGVIPDDTWLSTAVQPHWAIGMSDHLLATIDYQLRLNPNYKWPPSDADEFIRTVVIPLTQRTGGGYVRVGQELHSPPLDKEDGRVLAGAVATSTQLLVTCDGEFVDESGAEHVTSSTPTSSSTGTCGSAAVRTPGAWAPAGLVLTGLAARATARILAA